MAWHIYECYKLYMHIITITTATAASDFVKLCKLKFQNEREREKKRNEDKLKSCIHRFLCCVCVCVLLLFAIWNPRDGISYYTSLPRKCKYVHSLFISCTLCISYDRLRASILIGFSIFFHSIQTNTLVCSHRSTAFVCTSFFECYAV